MAKEIVAPKYYSQGRQTLASRFYGYFTDEKGVVYKCWQPTGLTLSVWWRLEPLNGGRARFVYDAGSSFHVKVRKTKPKAAA